jgi:nucleolar protein 56
VLTTNSLSGEEKDSLRLSRVLEEYSGSNNQDFNFQDIPLAKIREASIIQAKKAIQKSLTPDKNLIQSIEALDDAHTTFNLMSERFTTWYSQLTGSPRSRLEKILQKTDLPLQMIPLKEYILSTKDLILQLSSYLDSESPKIFSNLVDILGTQLAVRIVSLAGDLSKLARMPASTIQLLGAEKALFRHMTDGSPPPKYGVLYRHPKVKKANGKDKGRTSRKLAGKVAIASKLDYYGDKNE